MVEQIIPVVSKNVKILNDINQVVKKSFLRYFITRNGVVFTPSEGRAIDNGKHFSFIEEIEKLTSLIDIPERHVLMLESAKVYTHYKDQKKFIKYLKINDEGVYLSGELGDCCIGSIMKITDSIESIYTSAVERIMKKDERLILDNDMEALLRNEVVTYVDGDKRVRLTKTLIPHIKIGLPINITFLDIEDPNLFEVMLSITKDKVTNFHVYTCIKF
jgi:hypothetical protein